MSGLGRGTLRVRQPLASMPLMKSPRLAANSSAVPVVGAEGQVDGQVVAPPA